MNVTIRKIGNSEGIIIPKEVLNRLGLKAGDTLEIAETNGAIELRPANPELAEQLKAARMFMDKYRVALRELAK
ncbi:MAG TPA: AbrB/MazE/SpoVT family DNA-binding domain-containing protein [Ensifer sp.]|nr:AbrB/MazE/SpoVT family DNA-binding domain-containing protein [Ensifer sp.]